MRRAVIVATAWALVGACGDLVVLHREDDARVSLDGAGIGLDADPPDAASALGVWEDVTPPGLDVSYDPAVTAFGVQDVVVDPARPSDLYAFIDHEGVWRSTDYGLTWSLVSTGRNGDALASFPFGGGVTDHDASRDPSQPPTLWATSPYGTSSGLYRSTNGGVDWDPIALPGGVNEPYPQSAGALDVDPYDPRHLILGYYGTGMSESTDGGTTWRPIPGTDALLGTAPYVFFVDTGEPVGTAATWLAIAKWESNTAGVHRTTDRGASWTQVATFEHPPGSAQLFNAGAGVVYLPGIGPGLDGVYRSDDAGAHWLRVSSTVASTIVGSPTALYAGYGWSTPPPVALRLDRADRGLDTAWSSLSAPGMTNGPRRIAATSDGTHTILVSGNFNAGLWRYVEP